MLPAKGSIFLNNTIVFPLHVSADPNLDKYFQFFHDFELNFKHRCIIIVMHTSSSLLDIPLQVFFPPGLH